MQQFTFSDARNALYELARYIFDNGDHVAPRGMLTREKTHVSIQINDPTRCLAEQMGRKLNTQLAAVEALSIIGGFVDEELLVAASPRYLEFTGGKVTGAYGPRLAGQLPLIVDKLHADPDTRQAVMTIWEPMQDLYHEHGDRPCTTEIRFLIRDGRLITNTHMRSQDMYLGFTYDMVMFSMLHLTVANVLGVIAGPIVHQVQSLHVYERDYEAIKAMVPPRAPSNTLSGLVMPAWQATCQRAIDLAYLRVDPVDATERWLYRQMHQVHEKIRLKS